MNFKRCFISPLLIVTMFAGAANANLVTNGGFEITTVTSSTTLSVDMTGASTILPGWENRGATGMFSDKSYSVLFFPGEATTVGAPCAPACWSDSHYLWADSVSPTGGNYIAIDGDPALASTLSQTVTGLTVGAVYTLTFDYAGAQIMPMDGDQTEAWLVGFGDQVQKTPVLFNANHGFTGWHSAEMQFTATSTSQVLSFLASGTPTGAPPMSLLDSVSLTEASKVPEPASTALIGAALGALALTRRRKQAAG